jgi:two-component system, chemotaxis family, CheB/CheR fusion protein
MSKNRRLPAKTVKPDESRSLRRQMPGPFPIVGIGASAGGLEATTELLKNLPANPDMAFVVMQHLDPSHESALPALLARVTPMKVHEAKNNLRIEPNCVYVIPPNKSMRIAERRLKITPRKMDKEAHMSIDHFLESLANEESDRAIGVILSGNGSDGTRGLLAIKSAGGVTFAQNEKTAKYTSMPINAVAAGCVDFVLSPSDIAKEMVSIAGRPPGAPVPLVPSTSPSRGEERAFEEIIAIIRQRIGVDFAQYKRPTLDRRIRRRIGLHKLDAFHAYVDYLRNHPAEVQELFNDILIHVTGFFRDAPVFNILKKKIFPKLLKSRPQDEPIRIWAPGCSSGEEVYSLAIAMVEYLETQKRNHSVQVFGTDINVRALDRARAGFYPVGIAADVSADRLRRFFSKQDNGYRINKSIREMCIFARQNVVIDPPFSSIDLISCRNLLIYLGQLLQRKVFPVFHYALKSTGYLLLGTSETIGSSADLFMIADKKCKVYTKKANVRRPTITFEHPRNPEAAKLIPAGAQNTTTTPGQSEIQRQADRLVLTHFSPAGVVVNRALEVLYFRGKTGVFLEHAHGESSLNLLKMTRERLTFDLRALINKAVKQNARVRQENIRARLNDHQSYINVDVLPFRVPPAQERYYLVTFEHMPESVSSKDAAQRRQRSTGKAEETELVKLREELAGTRESLQAIIEEQEATNEELRSANEEIMSSNEELQSTNEELETAKEELQSTNEELTTLNDELENRNNELESLNNDLHNLLASVNIPVVMVGPDLRIRRFTNVAEKLLNLIPGDVGRPITDIKMKIDLPNLSKLIGEVIDSLQTKELEVKSDDNHWWSVRIRPYKTTDNKIDGAVLAFLNIDNLKNAPGKKVPVKSA